MSPETIGAVVSFGGPIGLIYVALVLYRAGRKSQPTTPPPGLGTNSSAVDCAAACKQFEQRRQGRCRARVAEAAAKTEMEARRTDYWAIVGALSAAVAAAISTAVGLPWPANLIVSLIFWTAATVLTGVMIFFLGKLNAATAAWATASSVLTTASEAVLNARTIVSDSCPADKAAACLNTPDIC